MCVVGGGGGGRGEKSGGGKRKKKRIFFSLLLLLLLVLHLLLPPTPLSIVFFFSFSSGTIALVQLNQTSEHFQLHCPRYNSIRIKTINKLDENERTINTLLFGNDQLH